MPAHYRDIVGERFGKLLVVSDIGPAKYGGRMCREWQCLCDCGTTINLLQNYFQLNSYKPLRVSYKPCILLLWLESSKPRNGKRDRK